LINLKTVGFQRQLASREELPVVVHTWIRMNPLSEST
jgi:hypothetical protein